MITIYKSNGKLETLAEAVTGTWINVVNPSPQDIACLQDMGLPPDFLHYPLDLDERSRTERENGDILIVLRVPYFQGVEHDIPYTTIPLGIVLNDRYFVTISKYENDIMAEFASGRIKDLSTTKRNRFVLRIFLNTAQKYLAHLRKIQREVDVLEDKLQASTRNREVLQLLKYQKSLTFFTTALKSNELMMERLQRSQLFKMYPEDEDLLEDVITENQQAIEMTNIAGNILSQMMDAFASIISNNLNGVMKILASITIVMAIPTMVASFYGMNVGLPMQNVSWAFIFVLGFSACLSILIGFIFWRRDWF